LLKGIVHPKMFSSFIHPQVVSKPMSFFLLIKTKEDIMKNAGNQTCWRTLLTYMLHSIAYMFFLFWKSLATVNCLVTNILLFSTERNSYRF